MSTVASPKVGDLTQEVDYLCRLFGQVLTAVIAGVDDARVVEAWAGGIPVASPTIRRNLQTAYDVARLLRTSFSEQSVRVWFMGMNPDLDDYSPVEVIHTDPERVFQAANDFIVHS